MNDLKIDDRSFERAYFHMTPKAPIKVLVVDDDIATRTLLRRWVERGVNAKVSEAEDGLQALEAIAEKPIDLVISDVNMPVLDGIEMLRLLRVDPRNKALEILVVSHVAAADSVRSAIELGASDYLLKPLQHDRAMDRIRRAEQRILERRGREESAADKPRLAIADPADDFCEMAKRHLSGAFSVRTSRSVAEMLVQILRWRPRAVLLSPKLPGLDLNVLFERVKTLHSDQWPLFVQLREPGSSDDQEQAREAGYGAAITKSFVGRTLLDEVSEVVLGLPKSAETFSTWADFFKEELIVGLYQTLGLMTGTEPEEAAEDDESWSAEIYGRIAIRADDESFLIRIGFDGRLPLTAELGSALLGEPVEGEERKDAFKEVLNVVAGRLRNACQERNLGVSMDLPEAGPEPPPACDDPAFQIEKDFTWKAEHRLRLSLQAELLDAPVGDAGEAAPEAASEAAPEAAEETAAAPVQPG